MEAVPGYRLLDPSLLYLFDPDTGVTAKIDIRCSVIIEDPALPFDTRRAAFVIPAQLTRAPQSADAEKLTGVAGAAQSRAWALDAFTKAYPNTKIKGFHIKELVIN